MGIKDTYIVRGVAEMGHIRQIRMTARAHHQASVVKGVVLLEKRKNPPVIVHSIDLVLFVFPEDNRGTFKLLKMIKYRIVYIPLIILACCRAEPSIPRVVSQPARLIDIDSSKVVRIPIDSLLTGINTFSILDSVEVFSAGRARLVRYREKFYYSDKKLAILLILNSQGRVIGKVGGLGVGKHEFLSLESWSVDTLRNQILVYSNEKKTLIKYDLDGNFVEKISWPFYADQFAILDSNRLLFFLNQNTSELTGENNIVITNRSGKILQRDFPIRLSRMGYEYTGFLLNADSGVLFSEPFSDTVFEITTNAIIPKYAFDFGTGTYLKNVAKKKIVQAMDYTFLISTSFNTNRKYLCYYNENKRRKMIVVDKQTNSIFKSDMIEYPLFYGLIGNIIGSDKDTLYSVVDVHYLRRKVLSDVKIREQLQKLNKYLYSIATDTVEYKGPIIMSFQFKF